MVARLAPVGAMVAILSMIALSVYGSQGIEPQKTEGDRKLTMGQAEPVAVLPGKAKRWALLIGIDRYKDGQISQLKGAGNDAHALAAALVLYAGFPADQVILLASDQPEERQPTRVNILRRLSNLASIVPEDGLLLVSFAGHGIERGGEAFLLPSDAQVSEDVSFLEDTAIGVTRMRDRIKATGVKQVLLLLDACRNDPTGRADAPNVLTQGFTRGFNFDLRNREVNAFAVLYATEVGKRAYEYTEKKQGYFTWAMVDGMKGAAANDRGEVTLARLVEYVQDIVAKRTQIDLGPGKVQRPFANIQGYKANELVVAVAADGSAKAVSFEANSPDRAAIELSFWDSIKDSKNPADFRDYLERYRDGEFAVLARRRLDGLEAALRSASSAAELEKSTSRPNKPESTNVFTLRHAHQSFTKLSFASATITVSTTGVQYREVGEDVRADHDLSFSCAELKEAKAEAFRNRNELKSIQHFGYSAPVKLVIKSNKKLDQIFTEGREADLMVKAILSLCGRR